MKLTPEIDRKYIRQSIDVAARARAHGNHPFGAVLVGPDGEALMEAENSVVTEEDATGHAETNLVRQASAAYSPEFLAGCTLYASTEPCPMCAGAIYWANIRRVVYGLSEDAIYDYIGEDTSDEVLKLGIRDVFRHGLKPIEVVGPLLEEEALKVHIGFWRDEG
jgi:tRNA(Arg) A34 adenosine deaminase TadA